MKTLAGLSLAPEHRRGHGALYDAVNAGRIGIGRLRRALAELPLPRAAAGRLMLAVDVSSWLRPGAWTSPERLFCPVYGRGKGQAQMIPGRRPLTSSPTHRSPTCPTKNASSSIHRTPRPRSWPALIHITTGESPGPAAGNRPGACQLRKETHGKDLDFC